MSYNTRTPPRSAANNGGLVTEKKDMQMLNERLSEFMNKVRALRQQKGATIDPQNFLDTLKMMEDEMNKCKGQYEAEIAKLRGQLNDLCREKNELAAQANKNTGTAQDLQKRLAEESNKLRAACDEINALKKALGQKDAEINTLRAALQGKNKELEDTQPSLARMCKEIDDLKNRLAREAAARQQAEDAIKQLHGKSGFDSQRKDQEIQDLKNRLNGTNNIIDTLQKKIKQLGQTDDANLDQLIAKIREGTQADLAKYQRDMDRILGESLAPLKRQLQEDSDSKKRLAAENEQLRRGLTDLGAKNAALEAEIQKLMKQNAALEAELNNNREKSANRIRELECRLQELQALIMDKLRDNQAAKGACASLRAEIETYRNLLEVEENKMGSGSGRVGKPMSASSGINQIPQYTNNHGTGGGNKIPGPRTIYMTDYSDKNRTKGSTLPALGRSNTTMNQNRQYAYKY